MFRPFFILFIIIFSSIGVVYAGSDCTANIDDTFINCNSTLKVNLEGCKDSKQYDIETSKCITPLTGGGSGSETTPPSFSSRGGGSSGGGCRSTGVGPDGSHGHGGASGAIGRDCGRIGVGPGVSSGDTRIHNSPHKPNISSDTIPLWVSSVILWWLDDKITQDEFKNTITYLLDQNIIPNDIPKPDILIVEFEPTTKRIFELWVNGNLKDNYILKIFQDYRQLGIW